MISLLGSLLALAGSILLYLAVPNQKLVARRPAPRSLAGLGWAALAGALALMLLWAGPATAFFIVATIAMLVLTVLPVAAAWLRRPRARAK
ncbi:hypothetical protein [Sphingosinicella sp. CPCC 101087]|uniref:hypothetical protein n=1 Tax=Sphingosinicella sp. CPCC 101087 TaxID=2497754 RepID=UPI00101C6058|nr:hypothetical protein [Sphingosinicella sp. CPCC 101087]